MSAVAAEQRIMARIPGTGRLTEGLAAAEVLYKGTMAFRNSSGFITATAGGNEFAGIVRKTVDNSAGAAGDKAVELYTEMDITLPATGLTRANFEGQPVYAVDNYTLSLTDSGNSYCGTGTKYTSATLGEVRIDVTRRATGGG